jgi:hypothetical protein
MRRAILPVILGLLGVTLFLTSAALAAPSQPTALPVRGNRFQLEDPITDPISHTTSVSHPVASAIAEYFAEYFDVDASEIAALHDEGLGFGVIAHAYFVARTLGGTPDMVLGEFQAGKGWGEIIKDYGLHPGLAGRGGNLGSIMSGRDRMLPLGQLKKLPSEEADTLIPPGHLKKNESQGSSDFVPPGQLKKSDGDRSEDHGGPPGVPPGHSKDKGKKGKKS